MFKVMILGGGIFSLAMAFFHLRIPTLFTWKADIEKIGLAKSRIHYTNNYALMIQFIIIGIISIVYSNELAKPFGVAMGLCILTSTFWLWRTIWQTFYFRLPKGPKPIAPVIMHYVLTIVSAAMTIMYSYPVLFRH